MQEKTNVLILYKTVQCGVYQSTHAYHTYIYVIYKRIFLVIKIIVYSPYKVKS